MNNLRCNLHTINHTNLKSTIQEILTHTRVDIHPHIVRHIRVCIYMTAYLLERTSCFRGVLQGQTMIPCGQIFEG